jgi:hypothetical protein
MAEEIPIYNFDILSIERTIFAKAEHVLSAWENNLDENEMHG